MAQQHSGGGGYKVEPGVPPNAGDHESQHHPHHAQPGPPPQHLQHPRPSSIVQQQQQQHHQQTGPPQHPNAYPGAHGIPQYAQAAPGPGGQHPQEIPYYHPSPYSTASATGTYSSAETPDIMAASQMATRPYPPISYHTPQSNSPASVASPSGHDQHGRAMYGQPPSQLQQPMYYPSPQQYPPMPPHGGPSPYAQHPQHHQQSMTSQPNLLMSHQTGQHPMQHPNQHQQAGMTNSPRTKIEHLPQQQQLQRPQPGPLGPPQHPQNGPPMNANNIPNGAVNPNAAPGPIPATTPLVVRQDGNGVQWIAFEYSRDRVKMEYTIRCDVESVNVDTLSPEFKTENCVYPRACCTKDQYRGNRLVYETECNTVGWALAELNPCLRGKRGLIQRAVDSWRNSNQDPRLRSRRVRRMAKINTRKQVQAATHPHMPGPGGAAGMPPSGGMGPGGNAGNMGKPGLSMGGPQLHHHHAHPDGSTPGGPDDGSVDDSYIDEQQHHHHQPPNGQPSSSDDVRPHHAFPSYPGAYQANPSSLGGGNGSSMAPIMHDGMTLHHGSSAIRARSTASGHAKGEAAADDDDTASLFADIPEGRKRKFILVEDPSKGGGRVRVRVTLDTVDTTQIPDSYRKTNSVYPRSWFPMQMQSPPPSAHGSRFFEDDDVDNGFAAGKRMSAAEAAAAQDKSEALRESAAPASFGKTIVQVPLLDGGVAEVAVPKTRRTQRGKEVKLNDLGYRMAWVQSRTFAGKRVFLQRALDCYRNKVRSTIESTGQDVSTTAPHFETRAGKRRWNERNRREKHDE